MAEFKFADEDVPLPDKAGTPTTPASPPAGNQPAGQAQGQQSGAVTSVPSPPLPTVPSPPLPVVSGPVAPAQGAPRSTVPTPAVPTQPNNAQARLSVAPAQPTAPTPSVPTPAVPTPIVPTPTPPRLAPQGTPGNVPQGQISPQSVAPANVAQPRPVAGAPVQPATQRQSTAQAQPVAPSVQAPTPGARPAPTPAPPPMPNLANHPANQPASGELARTMIATHAREHVDKKEPLWDTILNTLDPYAAWLFRAVAVTGALSLIYLLLMVFGGAIGNYDPRNPTSAQVLSNVRIATTILNWSLILMAVSLIILAFDESKVAIGVIIIGLALHFGVPWLLFSQVGRSNLTVTMVKIFTQGGFILTILGLTNYAIDVMRWLSTLPDRVKSRADVGFAQQAEVAQQRAARDANMFSPCWRLPYCREVIRKQCPAYLAKKRCWKFGRGCYCDEEMISRIIRGESLDVIKAPTRLSRQGRPPCGRCYIYLEHQTLKFRTMSWLAIPGTIGAMFAIWPVYTKSFQTLSRSMDKVWAGLSTVDVRKMTPGALETTERVSSNLTTEQVANFAQLLFGVILGFMLLIYISKLIEWAIFKAKL